MIRLGTEVKDQVTGFKGIAVAKTVYLNGCARVGVQAKVMKDGKIVENWFDEPQLINIGKKKRIKGLNDTGGPGINPPEKTHG